MVSFFVFSFIYFDFLTVASLLSIGLLFLLSRLYRIPYLDDFAGYYNTERGVISDQLSIYIKSYLLSSGGAWHVTKSDELDFAL